MKEVKLQTFYIEVRDNRQLSLFSNYKSNKLDKKLENGKTYYEQFLKNVELFDYGYEKKYINSVKIEDKNDTMIIGSLYYGNYGIDQRRIYNLGDNKEGKNIEIDEVVQNRFVFLIDRIRFMESYFIIFVIEKISNESPKTLLKNHLEENYNFKINRVIEKDILNVLKKNIVEELEYTIKEEKAINNVFANIDEENPFDIHISKQKITYTLTSDIKEKDKEKIISDIYRQEIKKNTEIKLKMKNRIIDISANNLSISDYSIAKKVEQMYSDDNKLTEEVKNILKEEFNCIKNKIMR